MTNANETRQEIDRLNTNIEAQKVLRESRMQRVVLIDDFIAQLEKRRLQLKAQIEREEACLVKPTGPCVNEIMPDGTHWKV